MYAVTRRRPLVTALVFVNRLPAGFDGEFQPGVSIEVPDDLHGWPRQEPRPGAEVLCVAIGNPSHYQVFRSRDEIDLSKFRPTEKVYDGIFDTCSAESS